MRIHADSDPEHWQMRPLIIYEPLYCSFRILTILHILLAFLIASWILHPIGYLNKIFLVLTFKEFASRYAN
jgi:hypothetical protein